MTYRMMELLMTICEMHGVTVGEVFYFLRNPNKFNNNKTSGKRNIVNVIGIFVYWCSYKYRINIEQVCQFLEFKHRQRGYNYYQVGFEISMETKKAIKCR